MMSALVLVFSKVCVTALQQCMLTKRRLTCAIKGGGVALTLFWARVLNGSQASHTRSLAEWPSCLQLMHLIGQSHVPGIVCLAAAQHLAPCSTKWWLAPTDVAVDGILQEGVVGGKVAKPVAPHALHEQGSRAPLFEGNCFSKHGQMHACHGVGDVSIQVKECKGEA
jgi:hypothetical protein